MKNSESRSKIYLLIDCSATMTGKPIEAVKEAINVLGRVLTSSAKRKDTELSVITFNEWSRQVMPLTKVTSFKMPELPTGGEADLSSAFQYLARCINQDKLAGDKSKPSVFVFTGKLSVAQTNRAAIKSEAAKVNQLAKIVICAESSEDMLFLEQIGDKVFITKDIEAEDLNESVHDSDGRDLSVPLKSSTNKKIQDKGAVNMNNYVRRLPVYLLLDCSGSMMGEPIEAVKQGIKLLLNDLKNVPQALETAYLSVITFDSTAQQVTPLTELIAFKEPELEARGLTSMGEAIHVLKECIERELRPNTAEHKGDWKPLVFLLTDGYPTDEGVFRSEIQDRSALHGANIIACAAGTEPDTTLLKQLTPNVLMMSSTSAGDMAKFFKWVTDSIKTSAQSVSDKPGEEINLSAPAGFKVVP